MPYKEGKQDQSRFHDPVYDLRPVREIMDELAQKRMLQYVFPIDGLPLVLKKRPFYRNFSKSQYGEVGDLSSYHGENAGGYQNPTTAREEA